MNELERRRRLEDLFAAHAPAVRAYAGRRLGADAVDDVVSDVFVVAWRRLDEMPSDALPWLLACARRAAANQRRGARRHEALRERLGRERTVPVAAAPVGDSALADALATLGARDREVLMLTAWEGLDARRASLVLGCSPRAFAMRLHRARRRLAAALADEEPSPSRPVEAVR